MKVIINVKHFRQWFHEVYLKDSQYPSILEDSEVEEEFLKSLPARFPCLIDMSGSSIRYIYKDDLILWLDVLNECSTN
ncbi:hypothetical protein D6029_14725 [Buttiauxella izardii]|uniref:Uncharacterized protein n=1 Tax=Buttiauxella izardii TaxID=82991 RepID=A0A3A5JNH2_9ENTR|nr:hypothetical protein D6029_14725 [Buttiauxella izardii]